MRSGEAPRLETERLVLRAHRVEDFPDLAALWSDPLVTRFISGVPQTPEESWSRLLRYAGHWLLLGYREAARSLYKGTEAIIYFRSWDSERNSK
jgi:RimJ/RimL family protein N-acetyltransferase